MAIRGNRVWCDHCAWAYRGLDLDTAYARHLSAAHPDQLQRGPEPPPTFESQLTEGDRRFLGRLRISIEEPPSC